MKGILTTHFLAVIIITCLAAACRQKEIRYEYHDDANKIIKSEGEFQRGELNGLLKIFDERGQEMEIGEWKNGVRDGLTVTFHPNEKVAGEYSFNMGKVQGKYKLYYETGTLKKVSYVDQDNFFYGTKTYNQDGELLEMTPFFSMTSDTLFWGDTLTIKGTLENVEDVRYFEGSMIVGSQFADTKGDLLKDTIAFASSTFNNYSVSIVPKKSGVYSFVVQLVYRFKTDKKLNQIPLDTLAMFSRESSVFVK